MSNSQQAITTPDAEYIDERALAAWVGICVGTLQQMRWRGSGPPYVKFGARAVRYHVPSVRAWLDTRTVVGNGQ